MGCYAENVLMSTKVINYACKQAATDLAEKLGVSVEVVTEVLERWAKLEGDRIIHGESWSKLKPVGFLRIPK